MIPIFIPSLGRPGVVGARTLAQIPPTYLANTWIITPGKDIPRYKSYLQKYVDKGVSFVEDPGGGISGVRQGIGRFADQIGEPKFIMLDDDLKFFRHVSADDYHLLAVNDTEFTEMMQTVEEYLGTYAQVSISSREGNNRFGVGPAPMAQTDTRALRALAFRVKEFNACEHGRVEVMEDFDVQLQLLRKGFHNVVFAYWAHDQQMTNASGGCSTYRTHELHERSAHKLAELHPGLVSLRQKENKTDRGKFGTRTEVTVQWKKAYRYGV